MFCSSNNKFFLAILLSFVFVITACGGGGGGGGGPTTQDDPTDTTTDTPGNTVETKSITGGATKGPLTNANVAIYELGFSAGNTPTLSSAIDTGTTNNQARIQGLSLTFPFNPPYLLEFTATASTKDLSTCTDPADLNTCFAPVLTTMRTVITEDMLTSGQNVYATPLTSMAMQMAMQQVAADSITFLNNLDIAARRVTSTLGFGMSSDIDIFNTPPLVDETTDTEDELGNTASYRTAIEAVGAVVHQIQQNSTAADGSAVLNELADDLANDGSIDGTTSSGTSSVVTSSTLQILDQAPENLPIPNTSKTVSDAKADLETETSSTGTTTDTTALSGVEVIIEPAQTSEDIDGDGVLNTDDDFPRNALADTDTDGDGLADDIYVGAGVDADSNGYEDRADPETVDTAAVSDTDDDNDGWLDGLDSDDYPLDATRFLDPNRNRDADSILNGVDNCPLADNEAQTDTDGDGVGDACSNDNDGDGVDDASDNCPLVANPLQTNTDGLADGGDACDTDDDEDGTLDVNDVFPLDASEQIDTDRDGIGDVADTDDDNDGVADGDEVIAGTDPLVRDTDGDGVLDGNDLDPLDPAVTVNFAPVAFSDTLVTDEDTIGVTVDVTANDIDTNGDTLVVAAGDPTAGNGTVLNNNNGTFTYTPDAEFSGSDSFVYTVEDGNGGSATATVTVTVNPVNDAPVATDDTALAPEDTAVTTVDVTANDSDVEGDTLTASLLAYAGPGNVVDNGNGTFDYTPAANFNGADSFTYTVSDGNGGSATGTVNITVTASNDSPVAMNDVLVTDEDTANATTDVRLNDSDVDGDALTATLLANAANGNVVDNGNGVFTYTPNADYNGLDSFTYSVDDGLGLTATATVNITVNPVNDNPVAADDAVTTDEDTPVTTVVVTANDSDVDGDTLTVAAGDPTATSGTVVNNNNGTYTYTPNANFDGIDSFIYTVNDGNGGSATATVNVTINAVNDAPVAVADSLVTDEDTAGTTVDVTLNDSDSDSVTLSAALLGNASNGSVVAAGGNTFTYTPNANFSGTDSFTYTLSDGDGATATGTVNVTVNPINDNPVAAADAASVGVSQSVIISVLSNDSDVDGDTLTVSDPGAAATGTLVNNGDSITYTDTSGTEGSDSFTYTVSDGNGGSATATVSITVSANLPPVATADSAITDEDTAVTTGNVLANDTDGGDGGVLSVTAFDATSAQGGSVLDAGGNTFTYTPPADFVGDDTFTYTVSDTFSTQVGTVTITVNPVNDVPVAVDDSLTTDEDTAGTTVDVTANDSDIDSVTLTAAIETGAASGSLLDNGNNTFTYTPDADFNGIDSFTYTLSDGDGGSSTATVNITVNSINDAPDAVADSSTTTINTAVTLNVLANDSDVEGDTLSITAFDAISVQGGTVTDNGSGSYTYTPATDFEGVDSFTYNLFDGSLGATGTVTITVNPPGTPIAMADLLGPTEGGIVGLESWGNGSGAIEFSTWRDLYNTGAGTFEFEDQVYSYTTEQFVADPDSGIDVGLYAGTWVEETTIAVVTPNTGDGSMIVSVQDALANEVESIRVSALVQDITGQLMSDYLDANWSAGLVNETQTFASGSKLVTQYRFEALNDFYLMWNDDWCQVEDPARFTTLNSNCNGVESTIDASGYATILDQVIVATAWTDPDDGSTPPDAVPFAWEGNTTAMVELVNGGVANYFVVDWNNADPAQRVTAGGTGSWVRDASVQGVDMIRFTAPQSIVDQFPNEIDETSKYLLAEDNGFVRLGDYFLTGDVWVDSASGSLLNGNAWLQIQSNFDGVKALAYNNVDLTAQTIYDLYFDDGLGQWCLDTLSFFGDGTFYGEDYGTLACDGNPAGFFEGTYSVDPVTGIMMVTIDSENGAPVAPETFHRKVTGYSENYSAKETCAETTDTGPFVCAEGDPAFGYELYNSIDAENALTSLNTSTAANPFPDAATLAGSTQYIVFYCDDCDPQGWTMETLEFGTDGSTYVLAGTEVGSYSVINGYLYIDEGSFSEYVQIISDGGATGPDRTCWRGTLAEMGDCGLGYDFHFDNMTDAQNFLDTLTFSGAAGDAATLLSGNGVFEFWDDEWDGTQEVPAYYQLSLNSGVVVDDWFYWSTSSGDWVQGDESDILLTSIGWQLGDDHIDAINTVGDTATYEIHEPGTTVVVDQWTESFEVMDISGMEMGLYVPSTMLSNTSATFSAGAQWVRGNYIHDMTYTSLNRWVGCDPVDYANWGNNCNVVWLRAIDGSNYVDTALNPTLSTGEFVDVPNMTIELGWNAGNGNLVGVFDTGVITLYQTDFINPATTVGTGSYTTTVENGETIIDYTLPAGIENTFNLHYEVNDGETGILSVHDGYLRHGEREPAGLSGSFMMLNSVAAADVFANFAPPAGGASSGLTCSYESGWDDTVDGGLGAPVNPNSFADFEAVLTDCGTAMSFTVVDIAGTVFDDGGTLITFNDSANAGTEADPKTGTANDAGTLIDFIWYIEDAGTHSYLVIYSDDTIAPTVFPAGFSFRDTKAITGFDGVSTYTTKTYTEQSNYGDMVRSTGSDGEIWTSTLVQQ